MLRRMLHSLYVWYPFHFMTDHQIFLVKKSWIEFQRIDPVLVGDVFYSKLFMISPRLKHMFHISTEEQSKKLVEMLNMIVGRLDRFNELTQDIKTLALRHVGYGVKPEHYDAVGVALIWTLQQGLGKDWNEEVRKAWTECYALLSGTMIEAASSKPSAE